MLPPKNIRATEFQDGSALVEPDLVVEVPPTWLVIDRDPLSGLSASEFAVVWNGFRRASPSDQHDALADYFDTGTITLEDGTLAQISVTEFLTGLTGMDPDAILGQLATGFSTEPIDSET